jgi:hypothetical protein
MRSSSRNPQYDGLLKKAGLRRVRFYDLRHSFTSLLLQQGESPVYVKEQLGHSSIQITVNCYGHLIPDGNKQAVDKLDTPINRSAFEAESASPAQPFRDTERGNERKDIVDQEVIGRRYGVDDGYPAFVSIHSQAKHCSEPLRTE